ncbi:MAG: hypothetical protein PHI68_04800 [Candidatus Cloacimonetes bacterium]|nr:hypothetical protein [Candidatus Cloacimonadota bacterium]
MIHSKDSNASLARNILEPLSSRIESMQLDLGIYVREKAVYYIIPTMDEYKSLSRGKEKIVEFSDAFYSNDIGIIFIRSPEQVNDNYLKILMHEYVHWFLDQTLWDAPLWFHEGMATYYSRQLGYEKYWQFVSARFWGKSMELGNRDYPQDKNDWAFFYLNSTFALQYMKDEYPEAWKDFWDYIAAFNREKRKISFYKAFDQTYNNSGSGFFQGYQNYTKRLAFWYLVLGVNSLIFSILPFVLIIGAIRKRRRMNSLPDLPEETDTEYNEPLDTEEGKGQF